VLGLSGFRVVKGDIFFKGKSIKALPVSQRVTMGIGVMFQHPPVIHGVKLRQIAEYLEKDKSKIESLADDLKVTDFLERDINVNFSGGEMKRAELFQILLQKPELLLLDEPESGVDIENISIMGKVLNKYLQASRAGCLIITHTGYILEYINARKGCVMLNGTICCHNKPEKIFSTIHQYGYKKCTTCECEIEK
jgi:Fe-S cluster assembly ATP-binding protein